jgi:predicted tellurium resistance membrane protein TerC
MRVESLLQLLTVENAIALLTLTALEVVLGIDNVVFIAILTAKLDPGVQARARRIGLLAAMVMRIALLLCISWITRLTEPLLTVAGLAISGKDLILLIGGLFLIAKATYEIHHKLEGPSPEQTTKRAASFSAAIVQIMLIDAVFSLDSVITAVGMVKPEAVGIMIIAIVIAVLVMMAFAGPVSGFVERHPSIKMLALAFLILIGVMLMAEGLHQHVSKGYIYFAMAFSLAVELLNIRARRVASRHSHRPPQRREPAR